MCAKSVRHREQNQSDLFQYTYTRWKLIKSLTNNFDLILNYKSKMFNQDVNYKRTTQSY